MDDNHKFWNANQKILRAKLTKFDDFEDMKQLLLKHHAMVHAGNMTNLDVYSFEDELCQDVPETAMREILAKEDHSLIWILWHMARIEDLTMTILVADSETVFDSGDWKNRLNAPIIHTGNEISDTEMTELNQQINIAELRAYRKAVGQATQKIMQQIDVDTVKQKVDAGRLQRLRESGAVLESASGIIDYWSKRDIAGLFLMPATRHNLVHLNEGLQIKKRLLR